MVTTQKGCTLVPALSVNFITETDHIRPFKNPIPAREVSLVVHSSFARQRLLKEIKKEILQQIPLKVDQQFALNCIEWRREV